MDITDWQGLRLSRLTLGTVQLGMPYGIANRTGQPDTAEAFRIVAAALDGGIRCFDTAAAYGTSEEVLGKALAGRQSPDSVTVITKVRPLPPEVLKDPALAAPWIEQSVEESRRRLRMDCLPIVLFHREADAAFCDELLKLRDRGWLRHAGVSCDNAPGAAAEFASGQRMDALQIPASVIDRRHINAGSFSAAQQHHVVTFVRSVFLQGLLLMPAEAVPEALRGVLPVRERLERLAADGGMTISELAFRFIASVPGVTSLIAGAETAAQVIENIRLSRAGALPDDLVQAVLACDVSLSAELITPSLWKTGR